MSNVVIVRSWKDGEYPQLLSDEDQVLLPEHPARAIEFADEELDWAARAASTNATTEDGFPPISHLAFCLVCHSLTQA